MWGVPMPDDEAARRKALVAAAWAQKTYPPLYRVSTMDPDTVLMGVFGLSSPVKTSYIFAGEDAILQQPRLEIHTLERGAVEEGAPVLWLGDFGKPVPEFSGEAEAVPVTVSDSSVNGWLLAATADAWMVSVEAPDAALLVMGTGEVPSPLMLEPVDLEALKRSELRNSGIAEI